jgi:hypothetical protein
MRYTEGQDESHEHGSKRDDRAQIPRLAARGMSAIVREIGERTFHIHLTIWVATLRVGIIIVKVQSVPLTLCKKSTKRN